MDIACNEGVCDEDADQCALQPLPDDTDCDDLQFCTETDTCQAGICVGTGDPCSDDGLYCTGEESCDEVDDACVSSGDPCEALELTCNEGLGGCDCGVDGECDDGLYCNGGEQCGEDSICEPDPEVLPPDCPDDGVYCNGEEICVEGDGTHLCESAGDPCEEDEDCSEDDGGTCIPVTTTTTTTRPPSTTTTSTPVGCESDEDCDDEVDCTDDTCVDDTCTFTPNDDSCPDDGLYCNGDEFCDAVDGCSSTGDPCAANETCNEDTGTCIPPCGIDVLREDFPKSNWIVLYPVLIRIETFGFDELNFVTPVKIECEGDTNGLFPSILKTGKTVLPNLGTNTTMIWQTALIWPAIVTGNFGDESETCTVTVGDCPTTDTFELDILSIFGIPLSQ